MGLLKTIYILITHDRWLDCRLEYICNSYIKALVCDHKCLDLGCSARSTKPQGWKMRRDESVSQQDEALGRQMRCCFGQGWGLMWLQRLPAEPNPDSFTFSLSGMYIQIYTCTKVMPGPCREPLFVGIWFLVPFAPLFSLWIFGRIGQNTTG